LHGLVRGLREDGVRDESDEVRAEGGVLDCDPGNEDRAATDLDVDAEGRPAVRPVLVDARADAAAVTKLHGLRHSEDAVELAVIAATLSRLLSLRVAPEDLAEIVLRERQGQTERGRVRWDGAT
jgi:hypothetical protein